MAKSDLEREAPHQSGHPRLLLRQVGSDNPFEEALGQLAQAIRVGAVPIGEKFPPQRELSELLGVSRSTVREAIRSLEQAGYVVTLRGRAGGTIVLTDNPMAPDHNRKPAIGPEVIELLEFRSAIEPGAAALAAEKADQELIRELHSAVSDLEEEMDGGEFVRKNCRLHILVAQATGCLPLIKAVTTVEFEMMDAFLAMPHIQPTDTKSHAHHRLIVDAIAGREPSVAQETMKLHLAATDSLMRGFASPKSRT